MVGDGEISSPGTGRELDANGVVSWLRKTGARHGWTTCSSDEAHMSAQQGRPGVAVWSNPGGIGHVAILRPGDCHPQRGLPIAQAGARNADDIYLVDGFGRAAGAVEFYTHA